MIWSLMTKERGIIVSAEETKGKSWYYKNLRAQRRGPSGILLKSLRGCFMQLVQSGGRILDLTATAVAVLMENRKQGNHVSSLPTFQSSSSLLP